MIQGVPTVIIAQSFFTGAVYTGLSKNVSAQNPLSHQPWVSTDGLTMFVSGFDSARVFQYTLTIAFQVSTATYANKSLDTSSQTAIPVGIFVTTDGLTLYVVSAINYFIYQYTLSTPWDISTATYSSKFFDPSPQGQTSSLFLSNDGTKMYSFCQSPTKAFQYTLSTPWDISTATYSSLSFDFSSQDTDPMGGAFSYNGKRMFMIGNQTNDAYQYTLGTAWDVSTAVYDSKSLDISIQESNLRGFCWANNGLNLYALGVTNSSVFEYKIGPPYQFP